VHCVRAGWEIKIKHRWLFTGVIPALFTRVLLGVFATRLASDSAAPVELAVALPVAHVLVRVVAAPAAQQITAGSVLRRHGQL
jgi:hypothetical protein